MRMGTIVICSLATAIFVLGCQDKSASTDENAQAASSATAASAAPQGSAAPASDTAGDEGKCDALGCKGEGTFFKPCSCKDKAQPVPLEVKYTGKYSDFFKQPEWEVTNKTDKDIHWASAAVYYYDKAGKQLEAQIKDKTYKASRVNGSNFTLKPKETKKITIGFKKDTEPKGIDSMEVVFDGWCFGVYKDKSSHLCIKNERAPEERPKSGN